MKRTIALLAAFVALFALSIVLISRMTAPIKRPFYPDYGDTQADIQGVAFNSLEEARRFSATEMNLPLNFVAWSNVFSLGDLEYFYTGDFHYFRTYRYFFKQGTLKIQHDPEQTAALEEAESSYVPAAVTPEMTSMLHLPCSVNSVVDRGEYKYYYSGYDGDLYFMEWYVGKTRYRLYPKAEQAQDNSLIGQLLSVSDNEADAAFKEIKRHLPGPGIFLSRTKALLVGAIILVNIIALVAIVSSVRKRKAASQPE